MIPRPNKPIIIETPEGLIRIEIKQHPRRRFVITLPQGMSAWHGEDRAFEHGRFLCKDENGVVKPKYDIIVPKVNENGELIGIDMPKPFIYKKAE